MIVFGVLGWIASRSLKRGQNWARYFLLFLLGLNIIQTIVTAIASGPISKIYSLTVPLIIGVYLLFSKKVKNAFGAVLLPADRRKLLIFCLIVLLFMAGIWTATWGLGRKVGGDLQSALNTTGTPVPGEQGNLTDQAWAVFESALTALKNHDLAGFEKINYIVPGHTPDYNECLKQTTKQNCDDMLAAFFDLFYQNFVKIQKSDLIHEVHDGKQLIMYSDPIPTTTRPVAYQMSSLYFVIDASGEIKLLAGSPPVGGVNNPQTLTDRVSKYTTDTNGDGYWDVIEAAMNGK